MSPTVLTCVRLPSSVVRRTAGKPTELIAAYSARPSVSYSRRIPCQNELKAHGIHSGAPSSSTSVNTGARGFRVSRATTEQGAASEFTLIHFKAICSPTRARQDR
eukprot:9492713-Pyramimonas_sp.AAC.2